MFKLIMEMQINAARFNWAWTNVQLEKSYLWPLPGLHKQVVMAALGFKSPLCKHQKHQ